MTLDAVLARIDETLPEALDRLMDLLRIPSISTDPAYKPDCAHAADWLAADLATLGFDARAAQTPGHPMVVGHGGTGNRHILFYGHYDVQPPDPLNEWLSPPFEPEVRGDNIYARGAADDRGHPCRPDAPDGAPPAGGGACCRGPDPASGAAPPAQGAALAHASGACAPGVDRARGSSGVVALESWSKTPGDGPGAGR